MSNTAPPEAAVGILGQIHDYHFFQKLASMPNPIKPRSQAEAEQLLKVAAVVREKHDTEMSKQAAVGNPFLGGLLDALHGQSSPTGPVASEQHVKEAASHWAKDESIAKAALEYNDWLLAQQG